MNLSSANVTLVAPRQNSVLQAVVNNMVVVFLGFCMGYVNVSVVYTFFKHQILRSNPRYVLFIHLVMNDILQVSMTIFLFIMSYSPYRMTVLFCCVPVLISLLATENTPLNLAGMALECYIAICLPLHHARICTVRRVLVLIAMIWVTTMVSVLPDLFLTVATQPAAFFSTFVFCHRTTVFPHPAVVPKRDATYMVLLSVVWGTLFYAYFKILFTAKSASKDIRKARNTILLHGFQLLLCMTTYAAPQLTKILFRLFPQHTRDIWFSIYVVVHILPRSISSIIYGFRDNTFRRHLMGHLLCRLK